MKLVLIMVLLIMSLMLVVGVFLMNAVVRFYLNDFNQRMSNMFSDENREFYEDLTNPYDGEENGVEGLEDVLRANMGELGVDGRTRNYFIMDAATGAYLAGSDDVSAVLAPGPAVILILLSILLTLLGGLIPSRKAAGSDPVTALRVE